VDKTGQATGRDTTSCAAQDVEVQYSMVLFTCDVQRGSLYPESFPRVHGFVSARKSPDINTNMMYSCSHSPCLNSASSAHTGTLISAPISCDLGAWSITSTPYFKTVGDALSSTHPEHHAFPNHPRNAHHALKHSTPFLHS